MPMSSDPDARARSLAPLNHGNPAPKGNTRTLRHGGYSTKALGPFARLMEQRFYDTLSEDSPLREDDTFKHWVSIASGRFARLESVKGWLDIRMGDLENPAVIRVLELEVRLVRETTEALERLKLAPLKPSDDLALAEFLGDLERQVREMKAAQEGTVPILVGDAEEVPDAAATD